MGPCRRGPTHLGVAGATRPLPHSIETSACGGGGLAPRGVAALCGVALLGGAGVSAARPLLTAYHQKGHTTAAGTQVHPPENIDLVHKQNSFFVVRPAGLLLHFRRKEGGMINEGRKKEGRRKQVARMTQTAFRRSLPLCHFGTGRRRRRRLRRSGSS